MFLGTLARNYSSLMVNLTSGSGSLAPTLVGSQHHVKAVPDWVLGRGARLMAANRADLQGMLLGGEAWTYFFPGQILQDVSGQP